MTAIGDIIQDSIDQNFALLGEDATYTPAAGSPVTVKVIPRQPDTVLDFGDTKARTTTTLLDVRVSELATPAKGDAVTFAGTGYVVQAPPLRRDPRRLIWTLDTRLA